MKKLNRNDRIELAVNEMLKYKDSTDIDTMMDIIENEHDFDLSNDELDYIQDALEDIIEGDNENDGVFRIEMIGWCY